MPFQFLCHVVPINTHSECGGNDRCTCQRNDYTLESYILLFISRTGLQTLLFKSIEYTLQWLYPI